MSSILSSGQRALFGAAALVVTTGVALSAQAAISGGTPTVAQIQNLTRQCNDRLGAIGNLTINVRVLNMSLTEVPSTVTVGGICSNAPILGADGLPSNQFSLTYSRRLGSATGPEVKDVITYKPPTGPIEAPGLPDVEIAVEGQCEYWTKKILEDRAIAAGIDVGPNRDRYIKVAETNCANIRSAIVSCIRDKGGEGC